MIQINRKLNRIEIQLTAFEMGKDICVILTGGEAHLGSVTIGVQDYSSETFPIGTHKEYVITEMLGEILEKRYSGNFAICCGIHLDNITKEEISDIASLSCQIVEEMCLQLKRKE